MLNCFLLQNTLSSLQAGCCFCVSLMIPWYWCEFAGVGDQTITLHILVKKASFPIAFVFPNSKEGSVNFPVMQSENLGGQWDTCVTNVPLPPATTPSIAWPKHQLWNDNYKLTLSFAFPQTTTSVLLRSIFVGQRAFARIHQEVLFVSANGAFHLIKLGRAVKVGTTQCI